MVTIAIISLGVVYVLSLGGVVWLALAQLRDAEMQRKELLEQIEQLADRIQSASLTEYKALERAEKPVTRREKDHEAEKWEAQPWA